MPPQWTPDLAVGVDVIDDQHKEIFSRAGALIDATHRGRGKDELVGLLDFLGEYVTVHFALEEAFMTEYGYRALAPHKAEHDQFTRDFGQLKGQYEVFGATSALVMEAERRTAFWLRNHISRVDRALGTYLKPRLP